MKEAGKRTAGFVFYQSYRLPLFGTMFDVFIAYCFFLLLLVVSASYALATARELQVATVGRA